MKILIYNENAKTTVERAVGAYGMGLSPVLEGIVKDLGETEIYTINEINDITAEKLNEADVMLYWAHRKHGDVTNETALRIAQAVKDGMGLVVLHSGHESKVFKFLMGTSCTLRWRDNDSERIWNINPAHPIAEGIPDYFELPHEEMYGERFEIPEPDEIVFLGWFTGGEVFRSGITYKRGLGKIFYFQPGHEHFPTYNNEHVRKIIHNATVWAKRVTYRDTFGCIHVEEKIPPIAD